MPRLSYQQPLASKLNERYVYSEAELKAAISDYYSSAFTQPSQTYGRKIIFGCSFAITKTIIINCSYLIIDGAGHLISSTYAGDIFQIAAPYITFQNLYFQGSGLSAQTLFKGTSAPTLFKLTDSVCGNVGAILISTVNSNYIRVQDSYLSCLAGSGMFQLNNAFYAALTRNTIVVPSSQIVVLGANSSYCLVAENICTTGGCSNTSTASAGNHNWLSNMQFGTIANHALDKAAMNS